jgi:hypothetical protein
MVHLEVAGGYEADVARVRVGQGIAGQNYCVMVKFEIKKTSKLFITVEGLTDRY